MQQPNRKKPGAVGKRRSAAAPRAPRKRRPSQEPSSASRLGVRVKFMGDLPAVVGRRSVQLRLPATSTVADLLTVLSETYGEAFTSRVFQGPTKLHHYILLFVDGVKVPGNSSGWCQTLGNGEVDVVMLPMFGGG